MFVDCLQDHFLKQHVTTSTRKRSLLDLIFTSDPDMIDSVNVLGTFGSSDHNMLQWDIKVGTTQLHTSRSILDYTKGNFTAMSVTNGGVKSAQTPPCDILFFSVCLESPENQVTQTPFRIKRKI